MPLYIWLAPLSNLQAEDELSQYDNRGCSSGSQKKGRSHRYAHSTKSYPLGILCSRLFQVAKPNNKWRPIQDVSSPNKFLKSEKFKIDTKKFKDLQSEELIAPLDFQGYLLIYSYKSTVKEKPMFSRPRSVLKIQSWPVWPIHCSHRIHNGCQGCQTDGLNKGIRIHQYLKDLLVRAKSQPYCLQDKQTLAR